ncbi:hypothetical protein [Desulfuribacillus alkaliarsenatis]|uniref:hypothetical protein n=1 Tax=Desulfuribacillus alkaliarsenatis TaxID=766136 RepID=UPI00114CA000|nr:hypothetical protein [Desulfuribacillus alkaliarsenatis]
MKKSCQVCQRAGKTSSSYITRQTLKVRLYRIRVEVSEGSQIILVCTKCLQRQQLNGRTISGYDRAVSAT